MGVKRKFAESEVETNLGNAGRITEDEAALYDRQIRLWGIDCQRRLREARILVIGLNGVSAEVVKNIALSGVKSITILDDTPVDVSDTTAQFFVSGIEPGQKRSEASVSAIRELNPNVEILIEAGDPSEKAKGFFANYNAVFAAGLSLDLYSKINDFCRELEIQFYCAGTWGLYGFCFLDLNKHKFLQAVSKNSSYDFGAGGSAMTPATVEDGGASSSKDTKEVMEEVEFQYYPLANTLLAKVGEGLRTRVNKVFVLLHIINHFRQLHLRYPLPQYRDEDINNLLKVRDTVCDNLKVDSSKVPDELLSSVFGELSPVCAVVGGVLANEIIKGISRTGMTVHNYFLFDGLEQIGVNELVKSSS